MLFEVLVATNRHGKIVFEVALFLSSGLLSIVLLLRQEAPEKYEDICSLS